MIVILLVHNAALSNSPVCVCVCVCEAVFSALHLNCCSSLLFADSAQIVKKQLYINKINKIKTHILKIK